MQDFFEFDRPCWIRLWAACLVKGVLAQGKRAGPR